MTKTEKRWWTVSAVIAAAVSFTLTKGMFTAINASTPSTVDERLTKAVNELKPALPKKIDELTTLIDVWHVGKQVTYLYELDLGGRQIPSNFVTVARNAIVPRVCGSDMKYGLVNDGVTYVYRYNLHGGLKAGEFTVTASDCT